VRKKIKSTIKFVRENTKGRGKTTINPYKAQGEIANGRGKQKKQKIQGGVLCNNSVVGINPCAVAPDTWYLVLDLPGTAAGMI